MTASERICARFVRAIYGHRAATLVQQHVVGAGPYIALCGRCLSAQKITIPAGFHDFSQLAVCEICEEQRECFDVDLIASYEAQGVDVNAAYLRLPRLRKARQIFNISEAEIGRIIGQYSKRHKNHGG